MRKQILNLRLTAIPIGKTPNPLGDHDAIVAQLFRDRLGAAVDFYAVFFLENDEQALADFLESGLDG